MDRLLKTASRISRDPQAEEIRIMAASPHGVITVPANKRTARLILVPLHSLPSKFVKSERGQDGFGSSMCTGFNLFLIGDLT